MTEKLGSKDSLMETKLYKRRWFILFLYVLFATCSAAQWVEYCIISNIIEKYYNVTSNAVNWTSLVTMVTYPPLLIPATYIIDKYGLRISALIAVLGTTIGTWIKVFSVHPDLFWVTFLGQTVVFIAQIFILSVPPKLASVWFAEDEVSRACGIGVFGQQFGTALGFLIPPLVVKNHDDINLIGQDLSNLYYGIAGFTTPVAILVLIFYNAQPVIPPSKAQALERSKPNDCTIKSQLLSYKEILTNKPFLVHAVCYGLNVGVFAGLCTILNQLVLSYFENSAEDAGLIGLLMIILGMIGSVLFGYILDKTRKYKQTTVIVYFLTALGVLAFTFSLTTYSKVLVYITGGAMGFFMNSYYPVGFEYAVELTYPSPEATSSGILISSAQTVGITLTLTAEIILEKLGAFWALMLMSCMLFLGVVITAFTPNILRRQEAFNEAKKYKTVPTSDYVL